MENLVPEQDLKGAFMFVQRPSHRALTELVQLFYGADIFPLLVARLVRGIDKFGQRLHQVHVRRLFQRDRDKRCHFVPCMYSKTESTVDDGTQTRATESLPGLSQGTSGDVMEAGAATAQNRRDVFYSREASVAGMLEMFKVSIPEQLTIVISQILNPYSRIRPWPPLS